MDHNEPKLVTAEEAKTVAKRALAASYAGFEFRRSLPEPAGFWVMPGAGTCTTKLAQTRKPRLLTRICARIFFELRWEDAPKEAR